MLVVKNEKGRTCKSKIHFTSCPLLHQKKLLKLCLSLGKRLVMISDTEVAPFFAEPLAAFFKRNKIDTTLITFLAGESSKTRQTKERIENQMLEKGFGKESVLIAVGGGVVSDLAGFIAATYCRGIPFIIVPTSLLGMVDASIGGKTGLNTLEGKNLLGSIYPAESICINLKTLSSLPEKEMLNGCAEIIKHGLVASLTHFRWMEKHLKYIEKKDYKILKKTIFKSIQIKKRIIKSDLQDKDRRQILNFGHTIGHAIEATHRYKISHGEAVAIGMLTESFMSRKLGILKEKEFKRLNALIRKVGFSLRLSSEIGVLDFLNAMKSDKKAVCGVPRFIILKKIGKVAKHLRTYSQSLDESILQEALKWMIKEFAR